MPETHKHINIDDDKHLYFVGDIHGRYDLLQKGVKELGIKDTDILVSVGDLIDRGHENLKCLLYFHKKETRHAVLGNHEAMMIEGMYDRNSYECWFFNGGRTTLEELGEDGMALIVEIAKDFPHILTVSHKGKLFGVIHAGIPPEYHDRGVELKAPIWSLVLRKAVLDAHYKLKLLWDRDSIDYVNNKVQLPSIEGIDWVIHGHIYTPKPLVSGNRIWIDTGGVFNDKLTFISWNSDLNIWNTYTTGDYDS